MVESPKATRTIGLAVGDDAASEKRSQIDGRIRGRGITGLVKLKWDASCG